ncbi:hypothetical protein N7486_008861 [Penicillium sp. IBT 16267x]|nr:hypothetical protein N7486_008861 [Penicillium sp. IBT 16267x]
MVKTQASRRRTVAVVGTDVAGLATAHLLHRDPQKPYRVIVLEKVGWNLFSRPSGGTCSSLVAVGGI